MMRFKDNKGITLIALIITIIVMLILVLVTINVINNGGLMVKAENAKTTTTKEIERERLQDALFTGISSKDGSFNIKDVKLPDDMKWCDENGNIQNVQIPSENGNYVITENNNIFWVDSYGNISEDEKNNNENLEPVNKNESFVDGNLNPVDENGEKIENQELDLADWLYLVEEDGSISIAYIGKETNITVPYTITANKVDYYEVSKDKYIFKIKNEKEQISTENIMLTFNFLNKNLDKIEKVNFNNINLKITSEAFNGATSLTEITGLGGVKKIDDYTFANCTSLTYIEFPEGFEFINDNAFNGSGLQKIKLPSTVYRIQNTAFENCKELSEIIINKTEEECSSFPINWNKGVNVTYKE